jgi:ABC-type branched-subunit amino acid transport system substrate-binding protein
MGLQVVYCEALAPKEPNYLPILETIAATGAEVILYVSSTFTNTDVYAMQWAMSSAKNIPTCLYGGAQQTRAFWSMTLGKCLGLITPFFEPTEEETGNHWPAEHYQLLKKAEEKGIPLQHNVHFSYAAVYLFKKAIEKVGKTDDINALINAIETTEVQSSLGKLKFQSEKVSPFYHSHILCDPHDPTKLLVGYFVPNLAQWQYDPVAKKPKIVMLNHIYDYNWDTLEAWTPDASRYIPPAVLRGG